MIESFTASTDPGVIDDLRARLRATRWPDAPEDAGWSQGVDVAALRELCAYWADGFDWTAQEAALNRLPRYRTVLGGHRVHFVHARAAAPALPLVLSHGWPDSFWRYLALDHPDRVVAVHRMDAGLPVYFGDRADLAPEERDFLDVAAGWGAAEGAYAAMHRTKPQTAAVGLNDSPAGLAAWIVEKMRAWSDGDGRAFTRDEILTNVTIYWLTGTIGSAMRMYRVNGAIPPAQHARRVEVPSGFSLYPADLVRPPRAWLDRIAATVRVTSPSSGGHFAPFENPQGYAEELREFFRPYRS
jgi:pimeloyl-ACP methyl ester carboxylesterase